MPTHAEIENSRRDTLLRTVNEQENESTLLAGITSEIQLIIMAVLTTLISLIILTLLPILRLIFGHYKAK